MKSVWVTDLHLEFLREEGKRELFLRTLADSGADAVLLGGDIQTAGALIETLRQLEASVGVPVYFVLGNHDYYYGSIKRVRADVRALCGESKNLLWLSESRAVTLSEETALVGHDGWGDGRCGNYAGSTVTLNDFLVIEELSGLPRKVPPYMMDVPGGQVRATLADCLRELGDEAADHFRRVLPDALESHRAVVVLTHVPPFPEAAWHEGKQSSDEFLPFFCCHATGAVLREAMELHPDRHMTVLCGHTHGRGHCQILPNLEVFTGGAVYGEPRVEQVFEF